MPVDRAFSCAAPARALPAHEQWRAGVARGRSFGPCGASETPARGAPPLGRLPRLSHILSIVFALLALPPGAQAQDAPPAATTGTAPVAVPEIDAPAAPQIPAAPAPSDQPETDAATPTATPPELLPPQTDALPEVLPEALRPPSDVPDSTPAPAQTAPAVAPTGIAPQPGPLRGALGAASARLTDTAGRWLPLPDPRGIVASAVARARDSMAARLPLPAPQTIGAALAAALPLGAPTVPSPQTVVAWAWPDTALAAVGATLSPWWTPEVAAFFGRLWPMLIPLALFLAVLAAWRSSLAEARDPAPAMRATHPMVQPGYVSPGRAAKLAEQAADGPEPHPQHGDPTLHPSGATLAAPEAAAPHGPPSVAAPGSVAAPAAAPVAARHGAHSPAAAPSPAHPGTPARPRAPATVTRIPETKPAARPPAAKPVATVPAADLAVADILSAPAIARAPVTRPGLDPPLEIEGLEADEVLTILAAAPDDATAGPEISVAPSPGQNLTRILLGDACIAVVRGAGTVHLDQINLIFTDPPDAAPGPDGAQTPPTSGPVTSGPEPAHRQTAPLPARAETTDDTADRAITFDLDETGEALAPVPDLSATSAQQSDRAARPRHVPQLLTRRAR